MRSVRGSTKAWFNARRKPVKKPREVHECYKKRDDKLITLGYASYADYLASEAWQEIREKKLRRYPKCVLCGGKATQVHHMRYDYDTLLGISSYRMVGMCGPCHHGIEYDGERKRNLRQANGELCKRAALTERGQSWLRHLEAEDTKAKKKRRKARKRKKS